MKNKGLLFIIIIILLIGGLFLATKGKYSVFETTQTGCLFVKEGDVCQSFSECTPIQYEGRIVSCINGKQTSDIVEKQLVMQIETVQEKPVVSQ